MGHMRKNRPASHSSIRLWRSPGIPLKRRHRLARRHICKRFRMAGTARSHTDLNRQRLTKTRAVGITGSGVHAAMITCIKTRLSTAATMLRERFEIKRKKFALIAIRSRSDRYVSKSHARYLSGRALT